MTTAGAHIHFEPRIWLAGRRLMSMSAAVLRLASATAAAMMSLRLRSLRSLQFLAAMTPPAYMRGPAGRVLYIRRRSAALAPPPSVGGRGLGEDARRATGVVGSSSWTRRPGVTGAMMSASGCPGVPSASSANGSGRGLCF
jgi:hypothetical protein